uniref:Endosome-associated-trafficking regulator 1 n=1 Tax=Parastrongyloides trichosuri TaxID=131310 RepID=A0A0N4Z318_PARTI
MSNFLNRFFKNNKKNSHNKENNGHLQDIDRDNTMRASSRYDPNMTLRDNQSYLNPASAYHTNNTNGKWKPGPRSCPGDQMSFKSGKHKKDHLDRSFVTEFQPPMDHKSSRRGKHLSFKNTHDTSEYGSVEAPVDSENHRVYHDDYEESEGEALNLAEVRIHNLEDALSRYKLRLKDALEDRRYYRSQYVALQHAKNRTERNLLQQIEDMSNERKRMQHKIAMLERQVAQYSALNCHNNSLLNMDNSKFLNQLPLFGTPSTSAIDSITGAGEALSHMSENLFLTHRKEQISTSAFVDDNLDEVKNFRNMKLDMIDMNRSASEE